MVYSTLTHSLLIINIITSTPYLQFSTLQRWENAAALPLMAPILFKACPTVFRMTAVERGVSAWICCVRKVWIRLWQLLLSLSMKETLKFKCASWTKTAAPRQFFFFYTASHFLLHLNSEMCRWGPMNNWGEANTLSSCLFVCAVDWAVRRLLWQRWSGSWRAKQRCLKLPSPVLLNRNIIKNNLNSELSKWFTIGLPSLKS